MSVILSIVVPVYNVEKYLRRCLDSLVNQTIDDYEIIVVNDGSRDNCQSIIDEYVSLYPNLIISLQKENGGLSSARNFGIPYAKGKYISFLDSDDYCERDYYSEMVKMAEKDDLDLVVCDIVYEWEDGKTIYKKGYRDIKNPNKSIFLSPLFAWNKIYRRELFTQLDCKYPEGSWYEDIPVTLRYAAHCKKIGHYNRLGIHYTQRSDSILGTPYSEKMYDIFTRYEEVYRDFKDSKLLDEYYSEIEYLFIENFLVYGAFRFLRTDYYRLLMERSFAIMKQYFPYYRKNPYLRFFSKKERIFLFMLNRGTLPLWHWYLCK